MSAQSVPRCLSASVGVCVRFSRLICSSPSPVDCPPSFLPSPFLSFSLSSQSASQSVTHSFTPIRSLSSPLSGPIWGVGRMLGLTPERGRREPFTYDVSKGLGEGEEQKQSTVLISCASLTVTKGGGRCRNTKNMQMLYVNGPKEGNRDRSEEDTRQAKKGNGDGDATGQDRH